MTGRTRRRCPPEPPIPVSQTCQMLDMPLEEPVLLVLSAALWLSPVVEGVAWATPLERVVQLWALAEVAIQTLLLEIEVFVFSAGAPLQEGAESLGLESLGGLAVTYE